MKRLILSVWNKWVNLGVVTEQIEGHFNEELHLFEHLAYPLHWKHCKHYLPKLLFKRSYLEYYWCTYQSFAHPEVKTKSFDTIFPYFNFSEKWDCCENAATWNLKYKFLLFWTGQGRQEMIRDLHFPCRCIWSCDFAKYFVSEQTPQESGVVGKSKDCKHRISDIRHHFAQIRNVRMCQG